MNSHNELTTYVYVFCGSCQDSKQSWRSSTLLVFTCTEKILELDKSALLAGMQLYMCLHRSYHWISDYIQGKPWTIN